MRRRKLGKALAIGCEWAARSAWVVGKGCRSLLISALFAEKTGVAYGTRSDAAIDTGQR
jgi:hypothetical protein